MVLAHATVAIIAGAMIRALPLLHNAQDVFWVVLLVASLLLITLSTPFVYFLVSYATACSSVHVGWQMECSDRAAHVRISTTENFNSWSVFPKFEETGRAFLLYTGPTRYYILPKASMKLEQQHELREMLLCKLQTA
jgi:hypothetical protein